MYNSTVYLFRAPNLHIAKLQSNLSNKLTSGIRAPDIGDFRASPGAPAVTAMTNIGRKKI